MLSKSGVAGQYLLPKVFVTMPFTVLMFVFTENGTEADAQCTYCGNLHAICTIILCRSVSHCPNTSVPLPQPSLSAKL